MPEFREFFFKIWVGPEGEENFAKFGWVAALSRVRLSFAKISCFVPGVAMEEVEEVEEEQVEEAMEEEEEEEEEEEQEAEEEEQSVDTMNVHELEEAAFGDGPP